VRALGYRSIVLQGHSLGTIQVAFYAATDWDPTIKAVILTGAPSWNVAPTDPLRWSATTRELASAAWT
jgi:pimeloyl-ACP methyl ester carboxylesterase